MASSSRVARALQIALLALVALVSPAGVLSGCAHAGAASARTAAAPPGRLDPSEEITPEELASIPEPVPAASRAAAVSAKPAPKVPDAAAEPRSSGGEAGPIEPAPAGTRARSWIAVEFTARFGVPNVFRPEVHADQASASEWAC